MIGRRLQRAPSFLEPYGVRAAISVHRMHVCDIVPHPWRTTMLPSRIRITYRLDGWRNQQRGYTRCVCRCALSMGRHTTMLHDEMCDTQLLRLDSRTEEKVLSSSSSTVCFDSLGSSKFSRFPSTTTFSLCQLPVAIIIIAGGAKEFSI